MSFSVQALLNNISSSQQAKDFVEAIEVEQGGRAYQLNIVKMKLDTRPIIPGNQVVPLGVNFHQIMHRFRTIEDLSPGVWSTLLKLNLISNRQFAAQQPTLKMKMKRWAAHGNKVNSLQQELFRMINASPAKPELVRASITQELIDELLYEPYTTQLQSAERPALYQRFNQFLHASHFDKDIVLHILSSILPQDRELIKEIQNGFLPNLPARDRDLINGNIERILATPLEEETRPEALRMLGQIYQAGALTRVGGNHIIAYGHFLSAALKGDQEGLKKLQEIHAQISVNERLTAKPKEFTYSVTTISRTDFNALKGVPKRMLEIEDMVNLKIANKIDERHKPVILADTEKLSQVEERYTEQIHYDIKQIRKMDVLQVRSPQEKLSLCEIIIKNVSPREMEVWNFKLMDIVFEFLKSIKSEQTKEMFIGLANTYLNWIKNLPNADWKIEDKEQNMILMKRVLECLKLSEQGIPDARRMIQHEKEQKPGLEAQKNALKAKKDLAPDEKDQLASLRQELKKNSQGSLLGKLALRLVGNRAYEIDLGEMGIGPDELDYLIDKIVK